MALNKRLPLASKGRFNKSEGKESGEGRKAPTVALTFSQLAALFVCIVLGAMFTGENAYAMVWESEIEISTDAGMQWQRIPSVAADGEMVHVVWHERGLTRQDIYYRHFNGVEWEPEMEISTDNASEQHKFPSVAADSGMAHAVWVEQVVGGRALFYRRFNGTGWEPEVEISGNTVSPPNQPALAVNGEKVHVAWADERGGGDPDIYYRYFNGTSWQPEQMISTEIGSEREVDPSIAVNGDEVYVVWEEGDVVYRHFNGTTWQPELIISTDSGMEPQYWPSIAADTGNVHVVWVDLGGGDYDVYYRHFDGITWQPEVELSSDISVEDEFDPTVAVYGDKVHVAWRGEDFGDMDHDIYYRFFDGITWQPVEEISTDAVWTDQVLPSLALNGDVIHSVWYSGLSIDDDITYRNFDGIGWQPELELSTDDATAIQSNPAVAADANTVHAVWEDFGDMDHDIYYRFFDGITWQPELELSTDADREEQEYPSVAADGGQAHVLWTDEGSADEDIYHRHFDGIAWQPEIEISTDVASELQVDPSIAVDSGRVHIVWQDDGDGDYDIYYRHFDGVVWQNEVEISLDSGWEDQKEPSITVEGDEVHVVWTDQGDGDQDIYYRFFNGTGWEQELEISTDTTSENQNTPSISVYGGVAHVVWVDFEDGDGDIYYRRGIEAILPDYIPSNATPTPTQYVLPGSLNAISASVLNAGQGNATISSNIAFYNESDRGNPFQTYVVKALNQTESSGNFQAVWRASSTPWTICNVTIEVDYVNDIMESNETNNVYTIQFVVVSPPLPPENLTTTVVNGSDILLAWDPPDSPLLDYYTIYRSADQRGFDFTNPIHNTSNDPDPLRTNWTDVGAADPTSPTEYYYVVRVVSDFGLMSLTSNTAGKWTKGFRDGRDAFSLPLEPFQNRNVSWYSENIPGTEFVRWMNATGHWVTHYPSMGEGVNDNPAIMGDGYEISLSSPINFTFCGYPASMIRSQEGLGDSLVFRRSLSAQVEGNDINLSWEAITGAAGYQVFRSEERNGLHNLSLLPIADTTESYWVDSGAIGNDGSEYYYMVIPVNLAGTLGSSTYSVGVITMGYQSGSDTFALPLKPIETHSLDWFCDDIPNVVGIAYLIFEMWKLHVNEMPLGVYDVDVLQGEGYQISIDGPSTKFTFVGY